MAAKLGNIELSAENNLNTEILVPENLVVAKALLPASSKEEATFQKAAPKRGLQANRIFHEQRRAAAQEAERKARAEVEQERKIEISKDFYQTQVPRSGQLLTTEKSIANAIIPITSCHDVTAIDPNSVSGNNIDWLQQQPATVASPTQFVIEQPKKNRFFVFISNCWRIITNFFAACFCPNSSKQKTTTNNLVSPIVKEQKTVSSIPTITLPHQPSLVSQVVMAINNDQKSLVSLLPMSAPINKSLPLIVPSMQWNINPPQSNYPPVPLAIERPIKEELPPNTREGKKSKKEKLINFLRFINCMDTKKSASADSDNNKSKRQIKKTVKQPIKFKFQKWIRNDNDISNRKSKKSRKYLGFKFPNRKRQKILLLSKLNNGTNTANTTIIEVKKTLPIITNLSQWNPEIVKQVNDNANNPQFSARVNQSLVN